MLRDTTSDAYKARNAIISANMKKRWQDARAGNGTDMGTVSIRWHGPVIWRGTEYPSRAACFREARKQNVSEVEVQIELGLRGKVTYGGVGAGYGAREVLVNGVLYPSIGRAHKATGVPVKTLAAMSTAPLQPNGVSCNFRNRRPIELFGVKYKTHTAAQRALNIPHTVLRVLAKTAPLPAYAKSEVHVFMRRLCRKYGCTWDEVNGEIVSGAE